jgi:large subunit ribosomal protein L31
MKVKIHPQYFPNATVFCACGNTFKTGSTQEVIRVEICSKCHPFFTGEMKYVDTLGRVEKFQQKQKYAQTKVADLKKKKAKKMGKVTEPETPKSLREMLLGTKQ